MQNKPNLLDDQMNVNKVLTRDYENIANSKLCENKPNTKPNKANLLDAQMNVSSFLTKEYENKSNWALGENKANSNPIQTQLIQRPKLMQSVYLQRIMKNNADMGYEKTKPIQTQFPKGPK